MPSLMQLPSRINLDDIELSVQEMKWLAEIGFIAPQLGQAPLALSIFHALCLCRPEADFPYIGLAATYMGIGQYAKATELLGKEVMPKHPDSVEAKTLLAMSMKLEQRNNEADRLLLEIVQTEASKKGAPAPAYELAKTLLKPDAIKRRR